jgi:hypothetical protein
MDKKAIVTNLTSAKATFLNAVTSIRPTTNEQWKFVGVGVGATLLGLVGKVIFGKVTKKLRSR